ncbi:kinase-like protein [Rickenella mellea]|uniref:non-specific serine/threonine protein kinase n=1 Tax=Rickenella mellea TaxID=50990 RepID=A0A4Y7QCZ8_9AGAM|nr:kinase-like protein [Rickenella mellea]
MGSGKQVAIKESRVSRTVKRPSLQQESRILQLLKGHPAIPALYGYGHLDHFEYISMELLGPSIAAQMKDGAGLKVKTVIRIVDQVLAALQHIHELGIVHRDVKPENLLCSPDDPSTIKVIDFGMSKPFSRGEPTNLNSHNGLDLSPRDDLESLAFVALYLLRGSLPWKPRPRKERLLRTQEIVRLMKQGCSGPDLSAGLPKEFGDLLSRSRSMNFHDLPDYNALRRSFASLELSDGFPKEVGELLPCGHSRQFHHLLDYTALGP